VLLTYVKCTDSEWKENRRSELLASAASCVGTSGYEPEAAKTALNLQQKVVIESGSVASK